MCVRGGYLSVRVLGAAPCETLWFLNRIWFILRGKNYKYRGRAQSAEENSMMYLSFVYFCLSSLIFFFLFHIDSLSHRQTIIIYFLYFDLRLKMSGRIFMDLYYII